MERVWGWCKVEAMEYTFGEIVDRLAITHLKLWHLEEEMARADLSLDDKGRICDQIVALNELRGQCVASLDKILNRFCSKSCGKHASRTGEEE